MNFQQIMQQQVASFSDTDKTICHYIYHHQELIPEISITKLAEATYTSKSSILRFVQKLGFKGYSEFKHLIDWYGIQTSNREAITLDVLTRYLQDVLANISRQNLTDFFKLLRNSHRIYLLATGTDQHIQAQNFARSFLKMNIVCTLIPGNNNIELATIVLENIQKDDFLIVFSGSGNNIHIKELLTVPLLHHTPIVSITATRKNWLTKHSLINFSVAVENDDFLFGVFASGISHMLINFLTVNFHTYVENTLMNQSKK